MDPVEQTSITEQAPVATEPSSATESEKPEGIVEYQGRKLEVKHNGKPYQPKGSAEPKDGKPTEPVNGQQGKKDPSEGEPRPVRKQGEGNKDYDWRTNTWKRREAERKAEKAEREASELRERLQRLEEQLNPKKKLGPENFKTTEEYNAHLVKEQVAEQMREQSKAAEMQRKNQEHLTGLYNQWQDNVSQWYEGDARAAYAQKEIAVSEYVNSMPEEIQTRIINSKYGPKIIETFYDFPHELDNFMRLPLYMQHQKLQTAENAIANHIVAQEQQSKQQPQPNPATPAPTGRVGAVGNPQTSSGMSTLDKIEKARKQLQQR